MIQRLVAFSEALREAGVPVGLSETTDAATALRHIDIADTRSVRAALAGSLIKSVGHRSAFDTLFELFFMAGPPGTESPDEADPASAPEPNVMTQAVMEALIAGDAAAAGGLARAAVGAFGRLERSRSKDWYSNYEVVRALGLNTMMARLEARLDDQGVTGFERRLVSDEFERKLRLFREEILMETRRRVARVRGPEAVASYAVGPLPEDLNFLSATADMSDLKRALRPLARKLATRISMKRKRAARGQVDIRRTIRHSLSAGGVPIETFDRKRIPHRPELFVLCDVSSSVARFSRFSLMLTHALAAQFSKVRSFAFVDQIDEVTGYFSNEDFAGAIHEMSVGAKVVGGDGRSDYGGALRQFLDRYGQEVGPKTTVLVLGDARTNYRDPHAGALRAVAERSHHTYWLNPEPIQDWDTGDSVASRYAVNVDRMVEVRNLRQLETFIARTL